MEDTTKKCPKCGSVNVHKQSGFARQKLMGEETKKPLILPNVCLEEDCEHKWFDENNV